MITIRVGCRLPSGIVLEIPDDPARGTVTLAGFSTGHAVNRGSASVSFTDVDAHFFQAWVNSVWPSVPGDYITALLATGQIFTVA